MSDEHTPELIQNQAGWDRGVRIALGFALLALGTSGIFAYPVDAALRVASILPFALGILGWCPAYQALGFSTRGPRQKLERMPMQNLPARGQVR